jgi:hypothetical protein
VVVFYVSKFNDIINIIIPFFKKYPIQGTKYLDYKDFCKVAELIKKKITFNTWRFWKDYKDKVFNEYEKRS